MKKLVLICSCLGLLVLTAQGQHVDSLPQINVLKDVVIISPPKDVSKREEWQTIAPLHLGQFLQNNGYGQILAYGPDGTTSSLRLRGLASDYTTVYWNDIPLNSITHGGTDLSMIPLFFLDEVESDRTRWQSTNQWNNMSNGLYLRSGLVDDKVRNKIRLVQSYSTLRNASSGLEWGWNRIVMAKRRDERNQHPWRLGGSTRVFLQELRNEFDYIDEFQFDKPELRQHHNDGWNRGLLQTLYVAKGRQRIELDGWWQERSMALPLKMGQTGMSSQEQDDRIHRMNIRYSVVRSNFAYKLALAENHEYMAYRDLQQSNGQWLLDSRSKATTRLLNNTITWLPNQRWYLGFSALGVSNSVVNTNYESGKQRLNWIQLAGDARWRLGPMTFAVGGRQEFREIITKPNGHLSASWKGRANHRRVDWNTQLQIARRFRSPDLNDLYWVPGGNPLLKPEEGVTVDGFVNFNGAIGAFWNWKIYCNAYYTELNNMIVWLPANQSWWSPINLNRGQSKGVDGLLEWSYKSKIIKWENKYRVQLNRSMSEDKLLPYMPQYIHAIQTSLGWSKWTAGVSAIHTSVRYTEAQNKSILALDPYWQLGGELGYRQTWSKHTLQLVLAVVNALDIRYQSVRGYAMPGRYVQLQISYLINQKYEIKSNQVELLRGLGGS